MHLADAFIQSDLQFKFSYIVHQLHVCKVHTQLQIKLIIELLKYDIFIFLW